MPLLGVGSKAILHRSGLLHCSTNERTRPLRVLAFCPGPPARQHAPENPVSPTKKQKFDGPLKCISCLRCAFPVSVTWCRKELEALSISAAMVSLEDGQMLKQLLRVSNVTVMLNWTSVVPASSTVGEGRGGEAMRGS